MGNEKQNNVDYYAFCARSNEISIVSPGICKPLKIELSRTGQLLWKELLNM